MFRPVALSITLAVLSTCSPIDNRSTNKGVARNYIEMLDSRNETGRWELYFADPIELNGKEMPLKDLVKIADRMFSEFPDLQATIEDQIAEGNIVVTRVVFEGTKLVEVDGKDSERKKVRFMAIAMDRFKGDKVVEMWHTTEDLDL
jgi:predicted ester cyclase